MIRSLLSIVALLLFINAHAQQLDNVTLKTGDLLFQNMDCGPLCDAIEGVTDGFDGHDFSHMGLVYIKGDSTYIIEAIGGGVKLTPIDKFTTRSKHKIYIGRLKPTYSKLAIAAVDYAVSTKGMAYDDAYLYDNGKYYCSELIYDAFMKANKGKPFFVLEPMTFKQPGTDAFYPAWVDYYKELNVDIPEGKPGINPGGISKSDRIEILNK